MLFSVIIPAYNRAGCLTRSVESVLNQSFKDFELIVVDDGSTDSTREIVSSYPSVRYIYQDNRGVSSARNTGIRNAVGKHIALLDSDDEWLSEKLEEDFRFIKDNPAIRVHQSDEIWVRRGVRVNPKVKHKKLSGDIFVPSLSLCLVSPSASVIERSVFDDYGLFDEEMAVCEDYDLWLRISAFENIGLIEKPMIIKYGGHEDQLSASRWGMDRYRIYSMLKLLDNKSVSEGKRERLAEEILKKCAILKSGALKRGNEEFSSLLDDIVESVTLQRSDSRDYPALLAE